MTTDTRCGKSWTGKRIEHCTVCHETFSGTSAGDKHRTGAHGKDRRCRTAEEMVDLGMEQNVRGVWTTGGDSPWSTRGGTEDEYLGETA